MTLKDLAVEHDYYCHDSNYYSNDAGGEWNTWSDFYKEYNDADIDMNLIFRYDVAKVDETDKYCMGVYMIHQRKGIFAPHLIKLVEEKDVPSIIELLSKHREKLNSIWKPL